MPLSYLTSPFAVWEAANSDGPNPQQCAGDEKPDAEMGGADKGDDADD